MISAGDFRNGVTIEYEGNVYQIIESGAFDAFGAFG